MELLKIKSFFKAASKPVIGALFLSTVLLTSCSSKVENTSNIVKPVFDQRFSQEDFAFPSEHPSLLNGKQIFETHCASCHAANYWQSPKAQKDLAYTTPIDSYLMLTTGESPHVRQPSAVRHSLNVKDHPPFRDKLTRDERWQAIFYTRYLAGSHDISYKSRSGKSLSVASIFGGNCAVCHGKKGLADGFLHTGHPSSHDFEAGKVHGGLFMPAPANFQEFERLYNRTDAQLFKYIAEGIYPSAMPAWLNNEDVDNNFVFDNKLIWMLVRHIRTLSVNTNGIQGVPPNGILLDRPSSVQQVVPPVPPVHKSDSAVQSKKH